MKKKKHYKKKCKKYKTRMERLGKEHDVVYIKLDKYHQNEMTGCVKHNLNLSKLLENTLPIKGPDILFDINQEGYVVGIEILY
ncbi:DUF2283 domain-containing protein [Bartonella sp. HY761]|uniref:DUF2283 domain-containing protein n=1 Tax=Bartonella sp. HY761 TaxID=2979330 RepID=UPI00220B8CDF|nr:DUF2283 domain-containing protein [Bartonella sp. HY761]UXN06053.1 DUF2283 domain-containing protein [Bartonella sp. HY761]